MADMEFQEGYKEVAGQLGLDYTNADTLTRIKRWLNLAYLDIAGFFEWSWLKSRETVTMCVDYATGTVSVTAASTTITFTDAPTDSKTGWYIQFSSANDWYKITAHTAAAATATISPAYVQTDNLAAGTFIVRKFEYSMSSAAEYIDSCREAIANIPVKVTHARDYDKRGFPNDTGNIYEVVLWGQDTSGNWIFTPFPIPSTPQLLEFRTVKKITQLSADTDKAIFPNRFTSIWLDVGKMYGYEFLNDDKMYAIKYSKNFSKTTGNGTLQAMAEKDNPSLNELPVLDTVDSAKGNQFVNMPASYEKL